MSDERQDNGEQLSFSAAMEELERILRGVESEETDIDALGEELKRAADLLEICRAKIRRAEVEVTQIVQSLEDGATTDEGAGDGDDGPREADRKPGQREDDAEDDGLPF